MAVRRLRVRGAHAGDWLPVGAAGRFALALRLYDSPLGATAGDRQTAAPRVTRERLRVKGGSRSRSGCYVAVDADL